MALYVSGKKRLPTLTDLLDQLATHSAIAQELAQRSLEAIEISKPTLNAFRVVLIESARAASYTTPLLDTPIAIQDDVDVTEAPNDLGAERYMQPATHDAEVICHLKTADAVILGKTNTCELGQWPFTIGPGLNIYLKFLFTLGRHQEDRPAVTRAAMAAALVTAAIGSDSGRVRISAAWTHLVGIKPQHDRIFTWPLPEAFNGITVNGVLACTVADTAFVLDRSIRQR
ncbi:amidase family protein [Mycobacterium lepromatosis]|uniref:amidase family protein n=1 Tax=Mycobacterium lepromatosis TaxID=480418 RepID=UPI000AF2518D